MPNPKSIFSGFLKYPRTNTINPIENQNTELLANMLRRSNPFAQAFITWLYPKLKGKLDNTHIHVSTQEMVTWDNQIGYTDLTLRIHNDDKQIAYISVEIKIDAAIHNRDVETEEESDKEFTTQVDGYYKHAQENETAYDIRHIAVLAKTRTSWIPSGTTENEINTTNKTWMELAALINKILKKLAKETNEMDTFLLNEYLNYLKEARIIMSGPFTLSEFANLKNFMSFYEKLKHVISPIEELKIKSRQIIAEQNTNSIYFRTDIHYQNLVAGIRLSGSETEIPEFFIGFQIIDTKAKKRQEAINVLAKKFCKENKEWKQNTVGLTYLEKTFFDSGIFQDDDNLEKTRLFFHAAVKEIADKKFNFLPEYAIIIDKKI